MHVSHFHTMQARQHSGLGSFATNWPDRVNQGWVLLIAKQRICCSSNSLCGEAQHDVPVLVESHSLSVSACSRVDFFMHDTASHSQKYVEPCIYLLRCPRARL